MANVYARGGSAAEHDHSSGVKTTVLPETP
jgi:hypothetical protein